MKNNIIKLLVIIFVFLLFTPSINAMTVNTSFSGTMEMIPGGYNVQGGADPQYKSHIFWLHPEGSSEKFRSFCINPTLGKADDVTCELLDCHSYPMISLAAIRLKDAADDVKDVVFRTLGMMEYQSNLYTKTGHIGDFSTKPNNVYLTATWHKAAYENGSVWYDVDPINYPYILSSYTGVMAQFIDYWNGNPSKKPQDACGEVAAAEAAAPGGSAFTAPGSGNYFTVASNGAKPPEFTVTSKYAGTTNVSVVGMGKTKVQVTQKWNGTQMKFKIPSCADANPQVKIVGVIPSAPAGGATNETTPYICYGSGNEQAYITFMGGAKGDLFNTTVECDDSCPDQKETTADKKDTNKDSSQVVDYDHFDEANVNLCCAESTDSNLLEYKLDNLFLSTENTYLEASNYTNKCDNSLFKETDQLSKKLLNYINSSEIKKYSVSVEQEMVDKFCSIYCAEGIKVKVPSTITTASGKYFKFYDAGEMPRVDAQKNCRIRIDYRSLRAEYEKQIMGAETDDKYTDSFSDSTEGEITSWNKYQDYRSMQEMLENYKTDHKTHTGIELDQIQFQRTECIVSNDKHADKGASYTVVDENTEDDCDDGTSYTCTTDGGCDYTTYTSTVNDDYYDTPDNCSATYYLYTLRPASGLGVYGCSSGDNDYCKIKFWQIDKNEVEKEFPFNKDKFNGLKLQFTTDSPKVNKFHLYTSEVDDYSNCTDNIDAVVQEWTGGDSKFSVKTGDEFDLHKVYKSEDKNKPHKEDGDQTAPEKMDEVTPLVNDAQEDFKTAKTTAEQLEMIGQGCEDFFEHDNTKYKLTPSANFHYLQVYLNGKKEKVGPEFIINVGSCSVDIEGSVNESSKTASKVFKNTTAAESNKFADVRSDPDLTKSMREADATITKLNDEKREIKRSVRLDKEWEGGCQLPKPADEVQMTLYPGPQVIGYYEKDGAFVASTPDSESKDLLTAHAYQYAIYLTTYEASYETWWDMRGLGLSSQTKEKFTKRFNQDGNTCAKNAGGKEGLSTTDEVLNTKHAYSQGTAEELLESPSTVPFTCLLKVQLGGMRVGRCANGVGDIDTYCSKPADINEIFEFRVVDPGDMFPNNQFTNPKVATNWRKTSGVWGKTYETIKSTAKKDETYAPANLTYSYKLNPAALNDIKDFNKGHTYNYFDEEANCTCAHEVDEEYCGLILGQTGGGCKDGSTWKYKCTVCKSDYLSKYINKYWNNTSKSLDTVRTNNHWAK